MWRICYPEGTKNNYYRLRNRLIEEIMRAMTLQYFDKDETNYIMYFTATSKLYFNRNKFRLSEYFLKKAEGRATNINAHELLDIIYSDFIKLSHELVSINPERYIELRKQNAEQLKNLRLIDDILAVVNYRLKINQNFSSSENPIVELLEKTLEDFSADKEIINTPVLRLKIVQGVSQIMLQKREYESLEGYLINAYDEFVKEKLFNKSNHNNKLQMLTYIVNTLFANDKLDESLNYAAKLKESMDEYGKLLYDKYAFFYYNALVLNYSVTNIDKGIELLEGIRDNESLKNTPFYEVFVYLNLAIFWFKKENFHASIKQLNKLYQHESFEAADETLRFKIAIAELIIRYEIKDYEFLERRIHQIKKEFRDLVRKDENVREKNFMTLLKDMAAFQDVKFTIPLKKDIKEFILASRHDSKDDAEVINYSNWLQSKVKIDKKKSHEEDIIIPED